MYIVYLELEKDRICDWTYQYYTRELTRERNVIKLIQKSQQQKKKT